MGFFNIEGMNCEEAKRAVSGQSAVLAEQFESGDKKAGRYIGLAYLMEAAERGDVTSQIALGNLCEFGTIVDRNPEEARRWYEQALTADHPKADGTMLARGASEGLKRLGF